MTSSTLDRERKKLLWLRNKLHEQEAFVRELELREVDPLNDLFERELRAVEPTASASKPVPLAVDASVRVAEVGEAVQSSAHTSRPADLTRMGDVWVRPIRRLPRNWRVLLGFIGPEGKTADEVRKFAAMHDLMTWDTARAGLMNYRREYGLLESGKRGHYRLSARGEEFIEAIKDESPTARESGEASESQLTQEGLA